MQQVFSHQFKLYNLPVGLMLISSSMLIRPMEDRELRFFRHSSEEHWRKSSNFKQKQWNTVSIAIILDNSCDPPCNLASIPNLSKSAEKPESGVELHCTNLFYTKKLKTNPDTNPFWYICALTIVCGVLEGSDVEKGGAYPVQSHVDITDSLENNLSIQVLHQVTV